MSVNCSHVSIIYVKIYEKILSGGLEVSFSIYGKRVFINLFLERYWSMIYDFAFILIVKINAMNFNSLRIRFFYDLELNKKCAGCLVMIVRKNEEVST